MNSFYIVLSENVLMHIELLKVGKRHNILSLSRYFCQCAIEIYVSNLLTNLFNLIIISGLDLDERAETFKVICEFLLVLAQNFIL